jgi:exopolyphosphatase/guanosine-5'-triphosphate,3'-diphosphate pyrophosphatase
LPDNESLSQILALRLAVLFYRSRMDFELPAIKLSWHGSSFDLSMSKNWLTRNPLTETALDNEAKEWKSVGLKLDISSTLP